MVISLFLTAEKCNSEKESGTKEKQKQEISGQEQNRQAEKDTTNGNCNALEERKRDCMCPQVYEPVCGCNGKTYSNSCEAHCWGIKQFTEGPCKTDSTENK